MTKAELLNAIAAALGATFAPIEGDAARGYITMPNGVRFFLMNGGYAYKGKVHIAPSYPLDDNRYVGQRDFDKNLGYNDKPFDGINVTDSKAPAQIAKDIQRRFLPTYEPLYRMSAEYVTRNAESRKHQEDLTALVETKLKPFGYGSGKGFTAEAAYIGRDYVTVKINDLTTAKFLRLVDFLNTL